MCVLCCTLGCSTAQSGNYWSHKTRLGWATKGPSSSPGVAPSGCATLGQAGHWSGFSSPSGEGRRESLKPPLTWNSLLQRDQPRGTHTHVQKDGEKVRLDCSGSRASVPGPVRRTHVCRGCGNSSSDLTRGPACPKEFCAQVHPDDSVAWTNLGIVSYRHDPPYGSSSQPTAHVSTKHLCIGNIDSLSALHDTSAHPLTPLTRCHPSGFSSPSLTRRPRGLACHRRAPELARRSRHPASSRPSAKDTHTCSFS